VLQAPETLQLGAVQFDALHRGWCSSICSTLTQRKIAGVTYGRAAKLVAVYLKATVIMGDGVNSSLEHHLHPPIDRILLQRMASSDRISSRHQRTWASINWTQLNESAQIFPTIRAPGRALRLG